MATLSNWATCGLVMVCLGGNPVTAVLILQGCSGLCMFDCCLLAAVGPIIAFGGGFAVWSGVSSANTTTNEDGTKTVTNLGDVASDVSTNFSLWYGLGMLCYVLAMGLGIWVVCQGEEDAGGFLEA
ncbi:hypothetical protein JCM8547_000736 [Rhodosporidiobolus lusitaniae]